MTLVTHKNYHIFNATNQDVIGERFTTTVRHTYKSAIHKNY